MDKLDTLIDCIYKYSNHSENCDSICNPTHSMGNCSCGFNALMDELSNCKKDYHDSLILIAKHALNLGFLNNNGNWGSFIHDTGIDNE